jgi:nucleoid-associated protein YgaU
MADLATLQQKYEPVLKAIDRFAPEGAALQDVSLAGDKLHVKATLPSQVALNFVWDQIKKVDPTYADLQHELINAGGETQTYTVKSGDMLSKIAQHFYGDGNLYGVIAKANNISDPNKVSVGTQLEIPVHSN